MIIIKMKCIKEDTGLTYGKVYRAYSSAPNRIEILNDHLMWAVYNVDNFEPVGF